MIKFNCPNCAKPLSARPQLAGNQSKCKCGAAVTIPAPAAVALLTVPLVDQPAPAPASTQFQPIRQRPIRRGFGWLTILFVALLFFTLGGVAAVVFLPREVQERLPRWVQERVKEVAGAEKNGGWLSATKSAECDGLQIGVVCLEKALVNQNMLVTKSRKYHTHIWILIHNPSDSKFIHTGLATGLDGLNEMFKHKYLYIVKDDAGNHYHTAGMFAHVYPWPVRGTIAPKSYMLTRLTQEPISNSAKLLFLQLPSVVVGSKKTMKVTIPLQFTKGDWRLPHSKARVKEAWFVRKDVKAWASSAKARKAVPLRKFSSEKKKDTDKKRNPSFKAKFCF